MFLHGEELLHAKRVELELFKPSLHILALDLLRQLLLCPIWIWIEHCFAEVASGACFALFHIALPSTQEQIIWGWVFNPTGHLIHHLVKLLQFKPFLQGLAATSVFLGITMHDLRQMNEVVRGNGCFIALYNILHLLCAHNFTNLAN